MAQLEVLQCAGCGSPLAPGALECEYCGNKNLIQSKRNPFKINSNIAQQYISFYSQKTKNNPKDTNSLYAMGLLYLSLKNYELAQRNLKDAIDQSPLDADVYYYYALSLISGKSIKKMNEKEIHRIEGYLSTAINMETKCKFLTLLAVIKEEYYIANHLVVPGESPRDLFEQAENYSPNDLDEISEHCKLHGENTQYNIDLLLGKETDDDESEEDDDENDESEEDDDFEDLSEEEIEAAYELTEDERKQYFDYYFDPEKPSYDSELPYENRYIYKPTYIGTIVGRILTLAINLFVTLIIVSICSWANWGFLSNEKAINEASIEEKVKIKEEEYTKAFTPKEHAELIEKYQADSLETLKTDSIISANYFKLYTKNDIKDNTASSIYIKNSTGGYIWFGIALLPLLIWIIASISRIKNRANDRKDAIFHNQKVKEDYEYALELYNTKPSDLQMYYFIQNYMSLVVLTELGYHEKDEAELKGKTLFLNEYFNYSDDGENYENSAIEYSIVVLEDDCVTVIKSDWRIYEDISDTGSIESISYSDIKNVVLNENELSFGGITIEIPEEQVFEFQNDDPDDDLTFSNTCTSDPREFAIALRKLNAAFKNK